ncbi:hypothetical protein LVJ94_06590 [Pendulispora rubella]|uniref:Uncharacterized protein n=1 Tax=Pendulispora rubella TaxID=2741070 RepID=A0ABZ2L819_9BACT
MRMRALLVSLCAFVSSVDAQAEPTLSGSIEEIRAWVDEHREATECSQHGSILEQLTISSDNEKRVAHFALTGRVLAGTPQNIPLFAEPSTVRIRDAKLNGAPATIGFENDQWFLLTAEKRFTLTGTLVFDEFGKLTVVGPINAVDVEAKHGWVGTATEEEQTHFNAAQSLELYFATLGSKVVGKAVEVRPEFVVRRIFRVGESTQFEYQIQIFDAQGVGVQTFPLGMGEEVTGVSGANAWEPTGGGIKLRIVDTRARVTIRGNIAKLGPIVADPRSTNGESLLLESDPEYEVKLAGGSPGRSRRELQIFPGEEISVSVSKRPPGEDWVGAAVWRHDRQAALLASGSLLVNDAITYDNGAFDELPLRVPGRLSYAATDGFSQAWGSQGPMDVAVSQGRHTLQLQSRQDGPLRWFAGRLDVPGPTLPLAASTGSLSVGLPAQVHPIVSVGGDQPHWFVGHVRDAVALALSIVLAWLAFARRRSRVACAFSALGLWCSAPAVFAVVGTFAVGAAVLCTACKRMGPGWARRLIVGMGVLALAAPALYLGRLAAPDVRVEDATLEPSFEEFIALPAPTAPSLSEPGPFSAQLAMPDALRTVRISRSMVTSGRPFSPSVYYVTDSFLWLAFGGWLVAVLSLAWTHRADLARLRGRLRTAFVPPEFPAMPLPREPYRSPASCVPPAGLEHE